MKPAILFSMVMLLAACGQDRDAQSVAPEAAPDTPLDLSREHIQDTTVVDVGEDSALLPELMNEDDDDSRVKLSGGVITNKDAPTLREKIEGAEVKLEVKTN